MKRLILSGGLSMLLAVSVAWGQWTAQTSNTTQRIRCLRALNSQVLWACGNAGAVVRSINGGTTWELKANPNATFNFYSIDAFDSLTACVWGTDAAVSASGDTRLYKTTDGGKTWVQKYQNTDSYADGLRFFDANVGLAYADPTSTRKSLFVIIKTTDAGETWSPIPEASIPPVDSVADEVGVGNGFDVLGNSMYIATYGNTSDMPIRVLSTTDRGTTWALSPFVQMNNSYAIAMKDADHGIICNYNGEIGRTANGWSTSDTLWVLGAVYGLRGIDNIPGSNAYVAVGGPTSSGISAVSKDGGATWTQMTVPGGVGRLYVTVFLDSTTGWAAGNGGAIVKYTGSAITDVQQMDAMVPGAFRLNQNFPNPFNPSTTITFAVAKTSHVELIVYDILGHHVTTLAKGEYTPGSYAVAFNGSHFASGMYFCTMRADGFEQTRTLMLLK